MTTGYTCIVLDKPETTFEAFALRCSRAFGYCIEMREESLDAPPPTELRPDVSILDRLREAEAEARRLETMTLDEAEQHAAKYYADAMATWEQGKASHARQHELFGAMLAKAEAWTPPTKEHEGLKTFMVDQLKGSMPRPEYWAPPTKRTGAEWLEVRRRDAADDVRRRADDWKRSQEHAEKGNAWLQKLRASLVDGPDRSDGT